MSQKIIYGAFCPTAILKLLFYITATNTHTLIEMDVPRIYSSSSGGKAHGCSSQKGFISNGYTVRRTWQLLINNEVCSGKVEDNVPLKVGAKHTEKDGWRE